jgi:TetR/AcrR family transcriptional regulator
LGLEGIIMTMAVRAKSGKTSKTAQTGARAIDRERKEQQRAIETREKILEAAIEEFAAFGYEGASVRKVARKAGAQHTQITYHFESKPGLWRAVLAKLATSFVTKQLERKAGLRGVDEAIQMRLLMEEFIVHSSQDLNLHKIMTHAANNGVELDFLIDGALKPYFTMMAELIAAVQARGQFVSGEPNHLHYLFIGATTRIFMQASEPDMIIGKSIRSPEFLAEHVRACLSLFFRDP